jgi:hypothetical protein
MGISTENVQESGGVRALGDLLDRFDPDHPLQGRIASKQIPVQAPGWSKDQKEVTDGLGNAENYDAFAGKSFFGLFLTRWQTSRLRTAHSAVIPASASRECPLRHRLT